MTTNQAFDVFFKIQEYYESIPSPKYRHVDLNPSSALFQGQKFFHYSDIQ